MFQRIYAKVFYSRCLAKLALNGKFCTEATDWSAFLYDPANADLDDVEKGLFAGNILFNVCYYICFCVSFLTSRYSMLISLGKASLSLTSSAKTWALIDSDHNGMREEYCLYCDTSEYFLTD